MGDPIEDGVDDIIECYYTDSDDGRYHSDSESSDSSQGDRNAGHDSDSDSDDTYTTDDGSLGSTYDYSYDSFGSDYYQIRPDHYDFHPSGHDYYGDLDHYGFGATFGDLYHRNQLTYNTNGGPGYATVNDSYPY